jgi:hypothetical protein
MKQITRYLVFVLLPFIVSGGFWFFVGAMNQHPLNLPTDWSLGDTINLVVGGAGAAILGAIIERTTRKKTKVTSSGNSAAMKIEHLSLFLLIMLTFLSPLSHAQSLKGMAPSSPDNIGGREPHLDLIPGKDDNHRWLLVTNHASHLVGMSKTEVRKLFGPGVSVHSDELGYQITKGRSRKSGRLACVELRITFVNDKVDRFTICSVHWL